MADLAEEISGCTGRLYDPMVNEESEGGADLEIVDETTKAPYTYMVLLATAPTNCNIQGICGAAKDTTLIWLKFTEKLSLASRQAFAIEDCRAGRSTKVERGEYPDDEIRAKNLPWVNGVLQIDFDEELAQKSIPTLIYDRQNPEAGLQRMDR